MLAYYYIDWSCPYLCVVIDALSKPNHYPERIFKFEASDEDEELRLRIQQVILKWQDFFSGLDDQILSDIDIVNNVLSILILSIKY